MKGASSSLTKTRSTIVTSPAAQLATLQPHLRRASLEDLRCIRPSIGNTSSDGQYGCPLPPAYLMGDTIVPGLRWLRVDWIGSKP